MDKIVINNLKLIKTEKVPIWLMRQAGRYMKSYHFIKEKFPSFLDMCKNEEAVTEITLQPIKEFDFDAAIIFSDILLLLDALEIKVDFVKNVGPIIESPEKEKDIQIISKEMNLAKLKPCYNAIKNLKKEIRSKTILGFAAAPWTLATYYIEGKITKDLFKIKRFSYENKNLIEAIIKIFSKCIVDHLINQIKAGVDAVQIFDTHAYQMDYIMHRQYSIKAIRDIAIKIKKLYPKIPIILYTKSNILDNCKYIEKHIDCISFNSNVDIELAKNLIGKDFCIQGNLDPISLVSGGKQLKNEVYRLLRTMKDNSYIFNLGHGVLPQTSTENVHDLIKYVRDFKN